MLADKARPEPCEQDAENDRKQARFENKHLKRNVAAKLFILCWLAKNRGNEMQGVKTFIFMRIGVILRKTFVRVCIPDWGNKSSVPGIGVEAQKGRSVQNTGLKRNATAMLLILWCLGGIRRNEMQRLKRRIFIQMGIILWGTFVRCLPSPIKDLLRVWTCRDGGYQTVMAGRREFRGGTHCQLALQACECQKTPLTRRSWFV